jgi:hypothetical protein
MWGGMWFEPFVQDVRDVLRMMQKSHHAAAVAAGIVD